jgi:hypothetical protein
MDIVDESNASAPLTSTTWSTAPETAYDDIACLAAQLCGVPIAMVS